MFFVLRQSVTLPFQKRGSKDRPAAEATQGISTKRCEGVQAGASPHKEDNATVPINLVNDPSAGSPTETLLRLLLPLNDGV